MILVRGGGPARAARSLSTTNNKFVLTLNVLISIKFGVFDVAGTPVERCSASSGWAPSSRRTRRRGEGGLIYTSRARRAWRHRELAPGEIAVGHPWHGASSRCGTASIGSTGIRMRVGAAELVNDAIVDEVDVPMRRSRRRPRHPLPRLVGRRPARRLPDRLSIFMRRKSPYACQHLYDDGIGARLPRRLQRVTKHWRLGKRAVNAIVCLGPARRWLASTAVLTRRWG